MDIFTLLRTAVDAGASDIHLASARPPMMRVHGEVVPIEPGSAPLSKDTCKELIYSILYDDQRVHFEETYELDCSFEIPNFSRFRVNVHLQNNGIGAVMRVIENNIPSAEFLGIGPELLKLTDLPRGLILVTGPTGSGKTNTLACMLNHINLRRPDHILTIEDPIEFVYKEEKCVITQRELSKTTKSFSAALRAALRQDPDVILVGEMRDRETIGIATTAAETGHLVLSTLHTNDAKQAIERIINAYPAEEHYQVRMKLALVLNAVVSQTLLPLKGGKGRVAAQEVLINTPTIRKMIEKGEIAGIDKIIEESNEYYGMCTKNQALYELWKADKITEEDALAASNAPNNLKLKIESEKFGSSVHNSKK